VIRFCFDESHPWAGRLTNDPAPEERGKSVTRDDYRTGEKAAGISSNDKPHQENILALL
jgi:hypothetical protein